MINITVCDDNKRDVEKISGALSEYAQKREMKFNISSYVKPTALVSDLIQGKIADIYILDVSMPEKNGFELAEEIRKYTDDAVIIFLTSLENEAVNGYKSKALRYIIKLNFNDDIEEALNVAIKEVSEVEKEAVLIQRYNDIRRLPYREIIFARRVSRKISVFTNSFGELTDNRGITDFHKSLDDKRFLFIERSCFVNVDYISQISGTDLILKNGTVLEISRRSLQNVKQELIERWGM